MTEERRIDDPTILEAARMIKAFKDEFSAKTRDSEDFMTITELENLWSELRKSTDVLYSDMIHVFVKIKIQQKSTKSTAPKKG